MAWGEWYCIEPEPTAIFGAQVLIRSKGDRGSWIVADIPNSIQRWVKASNACLIDGKICSPPDECKGNDLGWLCAIGDTIQDVLDNLNEYAKELPDDLECDPACLAPLLEEVQKAEDLGMPFTELEVPDPAAVLNGET